MTALRALRIATLGRIVVIAAAMNFGVFAPAAGQSFPARRVTIVVPFPPGGGIDILARALAQELSTKWGQPVIVDNKPGASTFVGADAVARAPADGHTLLATTDPTFTANRFLFNQMPYDPDKSFAPVLQLVRGDSLILVNPKLPVKDLKSLVALARKEPGKLAFSSYGNGTQPQLTFAYLNKKENIDLLHVPYKGISPAMMAAISNEVQLSVASAAVAGEMIRSGQLKALAVAGRARLPQFPDVPTAAEQGFPYLRASIWYGLFAPAGTPPQVIEKIGTDVRAVLADPAFIDRFVTSKGLVAIGAGPEALKKAIRDDSAINGEMIRAAGVKAE